MNKSSQHIAFVSNTSWSIYNFRLGIIKALISAGHSIYAIAPRDDYSDKLTAAGATYIALDMHPYSTSPREDIITLYLLLRIYRRYQFDQIIHYTIKLNIYGSIAARLCDIPSLAVVTGLGRTFQFSGISQWIIKTLCKIALKGSKEIWFLNSENRERFVSEGLVPKNKTFILPSEGVNTSKFKGALLISNHARVTRFLYAGRLLKDKGILEYVEAASVIKKSFSRVKFEVVGFVNPNNSMSVSLDEIEAWQKAGSINYLGSHEDIRPFINRADCIIFPSYYQEGISRILLEAASMTRPIITTDHVGCRDVVDHNQNGFLVKPRSVEKLVDAIKMFMNLSKWDRQLMGVRGRIKVKRQYDERSIIDIYFKKLFGNTSSWSMKSKTKKQINMH